MSLEGRRVLVVGGGTRASSDPDAPLGNGRAIAVVAARRGASIAVSDIDGAAAQHTADLIIGTDDPDNHVMSSSIRSSTSCGPIPTRFT